MYDVLRATQFNNGLPVPMYKYDDYDHQDRQGFNF